MQQSVSETPSTEATQEERAGEKPGEGCEAMIEAAAGPPKSREMKKHEAARGQLLVHDRRIRSIREDCARKVASAEAEVTELSREFQAERESMLDDIRAERKEKALLLAVAELFLPQREMYRLWHQSCWNEDTECWVLPKLKPRKGVEMLSNVESVKEENAEGGMVVLDGASEKRSKEPNGKKEGIRRKKKARADVEEMDSTEVAQILGGEGKRRARQVKMLELMSAGWRRRGERRRRRRRRGKKSRNNPRVAKAIQTRLRRRERRRVGKAHQLGPKHSPMESKVTPTQSDRRTAASVWISKVKTFKEGGDETSR